MATQRDEPRLRVRTNAPVMNPEHARWLEDTAKEAAEFNDERRGKNTRSEGELKMQQENKNAVEIFVGNVPHQMQAEDLAGALEGVLKPFNFWSIFNPLTWYQKKTPKGDHILRCCVRRKGRKTFAFVVLRSAVEERKLLSASPEIEGHKVLIRRANGGVQKQLITSQWFRCRGFQLCAEWPPGKLTSVWEVKSFQVALQVWKSDSLARIKFKLPSGAVGQAEFKRRNIDGEVKLMQDSSSSWLVFKLLRPPFLSVKAGRMRSFLGILFSAFGDEGTQANFRAPAFGGDCQWIFDEDSFYRSGDLSYSGTAFGSCLTYRIDISNLSQEMKSKLFEQLRAFRLTSSSQMPAPFLSPSRERYAINLRDPQLSQYGWETSNVGPNLHALLPYSVVYLIECLISNLKMEPLSITEDFLEILAQTNERRACRVLEKMFEMGPHRRMRGGKELEMELITLLQRHAHIFDIDGNDGGKQPAVSSRRCRTVRVASGEADVTLTPLPALPASTATAGRAKIRRVFLTPLRVVCMPPEVEGSNEVTRRFSEYSDRGVRVVAWGESDLCPLCYVVLFDRNIEDVWQNQFMRVTFADENLGRMPAPLSNALAERMKTSMNEGLLIAGRRYKFLAYSSSQLRNHSCWFYAGPNSDEGSRRVKPNEEETGMPTAASIRAWVGDLKHITNVGKHAARLGQSLSCTTATVKVPPHRNRAVNQQVRETRRICLVELLNAFEHEFHDSMDLDWIMNEALFEAMEKLVQDKKSGPYEFTDGCGLMSMALASMTRLTACARRVAEQLSLPSERPPPSAFQVRIGGCKGMLTVWPEDVMKRVCGSSGYDIAVRPSLRKFESPRNDLEVIQCARALPCYLNRQLITILTTLGVRDAPIERLYMLMSEALQEMVYDREAAETALIRFNNNPTGFKKSRGASPLGSLSDALVMLRSGFDIIDTPYLQSVLRATRSMALVELRNRARIFVPKGVCLLGVVDETGLLNPEEVYFSLTPNPGLYGTARDVELPHFGAPVLVGRNPSLHPGDLRVLYRADVPALHHLQNVLVFPCRGDRPEPSKMSGGDLDGDLYAVIWDETLLPPRNFSPMNYEPPTGTPVEASTGSVQIEEITEFVVNYIKNDTLGMIANYHLTWADLSSQGARCNECLTLAALHSTAVDFCKTGVPAEVPKELRPERYPDFMQKMEKPSYPSDKLLGRLFRMKQELEDVAGNAAQGDTRSGTSSRALHNITLDQSLFVPGWERHREEAEAVFGEYCRDLLSLARKYGVFDEGELLSCQVVRFKAKAMRSYKLEDVQGRLKKELSQFKICYRKKFQSLLRDEDSEKGDNSEGLDDEDIDSEEKVFYGKQDDADSEEKKVQHEDGKKSKDMQRQGHPMLNAGRLRLFGRDPQRAPSHGSAGVPPRPIAVNLPPSQMGRYPKGVEVLQKASAWYFVSHHEDANPYLRPGTVGWSSPIAFISFPWVCACEHLCAIKNMRTQTHLE